MEDGGMEQDSQDAEGGGGVLHLHAVLAVADVV